MTTFFDFLTVACFLIMVIAFFLLTEWHFRTLMQLLVPGILFAISNQAGNAGWTILAIVLVVAGTGYAAYVIKKAHNATPG